MPFLLRLLVLGAVVDKFVHYTSLFTTMVAENKKSKRLNKLQQRETKQLN